MCAAHHNPYEKIRKLHLWFHIRAVFTNALFQRSPVKCDSYQWLQMSSHLLLNTTLYLIFCFAYTGHTQRWKEIEEETTQMLFSYVLFIRRFICLTFILFNLRSKNNFSICTCTVRIRLGQRPKHNIRAYHIFKHVNPLKMYFSRNVLLLFFFFRVESESKWNENTTKKCKLMKKIDSYFSFAILNSSRIWFVLLFAFVTLLELWILTFHFRELV